MTATIRSGNSEEINPASCLEPDRSMRVRSARATSLILPIFDTHFTGCVHKPSRISVAEPNVGSLQSEHWFCEFRWEDELKVLNSAIRASVVAASVFAFAAQANADVVLAGYGGTIEKIMRDRIIPNFEKETGIKVVYIVGTALSHMSKIAATKDAPEVDVYWANDLTHTLGVKLGIYDKLNVSEVPNLDLVLDRARYPDDIGVAQFINSVGLQYNPVKFAEAGIPAPTSWFDLWDPRLKGQVALHSVGISFSQDLIAVIARLSGKDENDVDSAIDKIAELKTNGNLAVISSSTAELDTLMSQGQAWISPNASGRALVLKESGAPIDFVNPKEGGVRATWILTLIKDAPNRDEGLKLVNYLLSPEVQKVVAETMMAAPSGKGIEISEEMQKLVPYGDDALSKLITLDREAQNEHLDEWVEKWNRRIETN